MSIKFPNMKRFFSLFLAAVMMAGLLAVNAHAASSNKITDYGDAYGHWAYEALTWAVDNGVMVGTSEDKINPDGYLTRAQMAAMIDRLFGTYKSADISRYTDVSRGGWYYDYIAQAVHMGTFAGYSNSRMGPDENITREQAIVPALCQQFRSFPVPGPERGGDLGRRRRFRYGGARLCQWLQRWPLEPQGPDHPCGDGADHVQHLPERL